MQGSLVKKFEVVLQQIDDQTAQAYENQIPLLIAFVNEHMVKREDITDFIGHNPLDVLHGDHRHHADFIASQLRLKSAETLVKTIIWVYQSYISRGFSPSYFPIDTRLWLAAVQRCIPAPHHEPITRLYQHILESHRDFLVLSQVPTVAPEIDEQLTTYFRRYFDALLAPNSREAVQVAREYIQTVQDIPIWWERIIWPSMYEIGRLWSNGEITVGQEHMATSITQRIMSLYYPMILELPREKGAIVVTVSPGEFHEIGARMLADMLELNGWDVYYTGANTPRESLLELIEQHQAAYLCISTTIAAHLTRVAQIISSIRTTALSNPVHVIVGGQAYMTDSDTWRDVGADAFIVSASKTVEYLQARYECNGNQPSGDNGQGPGRPRPDLAHS